MAAAACWHALKRFDLSWVRNLIMSNWTKDQLFALNYGTPFRVSSDRIGCKDFFCKVYQKLRQTTFAYSSQNGNTSSKRGLYYRYIVEHIVPAFQQTWNIHVKELICPNLNVINYKVDMTWQSFSTLIAYIIYGMTVGLLTRLHILYVT